ncbi:MAG: hypothetical protein GX594_07305, partial [Pirellulaceae bacterium]|nr:hypothetical protein [Pirellulaceae bacterium]
MTGKGLDRIDAWLDSELSDEEFVELENWLKSDPANIETFALAGTLHRRLRDVLCAQSAALDGSKEAVLGGDSSGCRHGGISASPAVPLITTSPDEPRFSWFGSEPFVGGWAFSYIVASVFVCLLLLGFWAYKLPSDRGWYLADGANSTNADSRGLTDPGESSPDRPAPVFVGRITGIAGAKWSDDPDYLPPIGIYVRLGRQYKLKSGLLEITYDSGAKVILEGPC